MNFESRRLSHPAGAVRERGVGAGLKFPCTTAFVIAAAVMVHLIPGAVNTLQYDRAAIAGGEVWRWLTGHLTHFGSNHLWWDLAVFAALGVVVERQAPGRMLAGLCAGAAAIPAALWCFQPQFEFYRGLSGLDCALAGLLVASLAGRREWVARMTALGTIILVAGKCSYELVTAETLFAAGRDYVPVPLAHLVGFGIGVGSVALEYVVGLGQRIVRRFGPAHRCGPIPARSTLRTACHLMGGALRRR